jgi:hypothetical protein
MLETAKGAPVVLKLPVQDGDDVGDVGALQDLGTAQGLKSGPGLSMEIRSPAAIVGQQW